MRRLSPAGPAAISGAAEKRWAERRRSQRARAAIEQWAATLRRWSGDAYASGESQRGPSSPRAAGAESIVERQPLGLLGEDLDVERP